jgi:hypothetical protein
VILERVEKGVSGAINASVYVAQYLFVRIALISVILSLIGCMLDGDSFGRLLRIAYWRFFEMFLWLTFIAWTWQGPGGIPGWFPTIIGGIAAIGAQIANQVAGTPIATFQNYTFDFTIMPGTILDLGAGLYSAISSLAWAMFTGGGSTISGPAGAIVSTAAVAGSVLNGTALPNFAIYCMMEGAAIYVYFVCFFIAWRYFLAVINVFVIACLSFFQGFAGSRRLSGYAGGFLSTAIVLGAEFALTTIIVGIFYGVLIWLIQSTSLWAPVSAIIAASAAIVAPPIAWAKTGINLGYLLLLDMIVTAWAMTIYSVPKKVGDYFAGRLSLAPSEAIKFASSSPTMGGKLLGAAGSTVKSFAERGPFGATLHGIGKLGSYGLIGASTNKRGTMAGAVEGAVRAGTVGGVPGAFAGAVGSWVAGKYVPTKNAYSTQNAEQKGEASKNGSTSSAAANNDVTQRSQASSSTLIPSADVHSDETQNGESADNAFAPLGTAQNGTKTTESTSANIPPPEKPHDATVERKVRVVDTFSAENADPDNGELTSTSSSQKTISGTFETESSANAKALKAGATRPQSNPLYEEYAKGMNEWEQMKSGTPAQEMLAEVERQTRIGASIARTVSYAHQYRVARGERQQPDEQSIMIPQPNLTFGDR